MTFIDTGGGGSDPISESLRLSGLPALAAQTPAAAVGERFPTQQETSDPISAALRLQPTLSLGDLATGNQAVAARFPTTAEQLPYGLNPLAQFQPPKPATPASLTTLTKPETPPERQEPPPPSAAPLKPAVHQPYISGNGGREPAAWGSMDDTQAAARRFYRDRPAGGPYMPQPADWPGVLQKAGGGIGALGSMFAAVPSLLMGEALGAYYDSYRRGQLENARIQHAKFTNYLEQTIDRQNQISREYGEAFATYGPRTVDGKFDPGNENALREAINEIAARRQDHRMEQVMARDGLPAAVRLIQHLDGQAQDLSKVKQQLELERLRQSVEKGKEEQEQRRKDREDDAKREREFGLGGAPATPEAPAAPAAPEPPAPAQPGPAPAPNVAGAAPTPEPSPAPTTTGQAPAAERAPTAAPRVRAAAQAEQMGEKPDSKEWTPRIRDAVDKDKAALDGYMHDQIVQAQNGAIDKDALKARVRAANPAMGELVDGLLDGTTELTKQDSAKPHNRLAAAIAKQVDPNYERTAVERRNKRQQQADLLQIRPMQRALGEQYALHERLSDTLGKNLHDGYNLIALAQKLKDKGLDTQIPIVDRYVREGRRTVFGDVDVQKFYTAMTTFRADVGRILGGSGAAGTGAVYPVSVQKEMREFLDIGLSVPQLRGSLEVIKQDYRNKLKPITDRINVLSGRIADIMKVAPPAPVHDEELNRQLDAEQVKIIDGKFYYFRDGKWYDD